MTQDGDPPPEDEGGDAPAPGDGTSEVPEGTIAAKLANAKDKPELVLSQGEADALTRGQDYRKAEQDIANRKRIADGAVALMVAQVVIANLVFIYYFVKVGPSDVEVGALQVWLGTTVVQIVGVVLVITQYLFPADGKGGGPRR